jgi:uncharacterized protein YggE
MKKFSILILGLAFSVALMAQAEKNPYPRTITVQGSAEMELVPDEIYVLVDLKEYEKKGQGKVSIDKIKQDFLSDARSVGIPDSAISIAAYDGLNGNPWLRKKKKDELMASIAYQIKLKTSKQMDDLVAVLDDNATSNFSIIRTSHSKLAEYRKQLKIQAVKAAREKGRYLVEAIDEKLGDAVTINEPVEYTVQPFYNTRIANQMLVKSGQIGEEEEASVDFRKIKLKYDVSVVFAITD